MQKKSKNSKLGNACDNKYITWSKKKKKNKWNKDED